MVWWEQYLQRSIYNDDTINDYDYGGGDGHQDGEGSITGYDDRVRRHAAGPSVPINIVKSLTMMDDDDISQQSN